MTSQQEASADIAKKMDEIRKLITECEAIADEAQVDFGWSGPSYGMGGWYSPKKTKTKTEASEDDGWDESDEWESSSEGWQASSSSC